MLTRYISKAVKSPSIIVNYHAQASWNSEKLLLYVSNLTRSPLKLYFNYADRASLSLARRTFSPYCNIDHQYSFWPGEHVSDVRRIHAPLTKQIFPTNSVLYGHLDAATIDQLSMRCHELMPGGILSVKRPPLFNQYLMARLRFEQIAENGLIFQRI